MTSQLTSGKAETQGKGFLLAPPRFILRFLTGGSGSGSGRGRGSISIGLLTLVVVDTTGFEGGRVGFVALAEFTARLTSTGLGLLTGLAAGAGTKGSELGGCWEEEELSRISTTFKGFKVVLPPKTLAPVPGET